MAKLSDRRILDIIRGDGRYPVQAYVFLLNEGWPRALRHADGDQAPPSPAPASGKAPRHVSWNIHKTVDFGNMVYLLIQHDVMHKTEEDSLEDFRDVYSFAEAFATPSQFDLKE
jgi:hypothetical protein